MRVNWTDLGILTRAKCEREPTIPDPVMSTEAQDLRPGQFSAVPAGLSSGKPGSHLTLKANKCEGEHSRGFENPLPGLKSGLAQVSSNSSMAHLGSWERREQAPQEKPTSSQRRASVAADPARLSARSAMVLRGRTDAAANFRCPECYSTECSDKASRHHRRVCAPLRSKPGAFAPRQHSSFRLPGIWRNPYLRQTARLTLSPRKCHAEMKEDL